MSRRSEITPKQVEFIPKNLEDGVLYISERFKTASHLCCCGCGQKVVTPLNPAKWHLTVHGSAVSLCPSIGLGTLPCRSHYWIRQSKIDWYPNMTAEQTARAQRADEFASQVFTGERKLPPPAQQESGFGAAVRGLWASFVEWLRSLWK